MSYQIKMRDHTVLTVPDEAGFKLQEHIRSLKKPEHLKIGDSIYLSSLIVSVEKTFLKSASSSQLAAPKFNCVLNGTSIQAEIRRRAKLHKNWPKLVQDKAWRSRTRQEIILEDPDKEWCDYLAGAHACL